MQEDFSVARLPRNDNITAELTAESQLGQAETQWVEPVEINLQITVTCGRENGEVLAVV